MSEPELFDPYEGDYIKAFDIGYDEDGVKKPVTVTISSVDAPNTVRDASGKLIKQAVVHFSGTQKAFVAGKINQQLIALIHGKKPSGWIEKELTLTVRFGDWFGEKNVPAVRVVLPDHLPMPFGMRKNYGRETPAQ